VTELWKLFMTASMALNWPCLFVMNKFWREELKQAREDIERLEYEIGIRTEEAKCNRNRTQNQPRP
jgi:hypothetical protein